MEGSPSRTALMAAVLRARHAMVEPPPWVLEDPIALDLVGPEWRQMADYSDAHWSGELGRQMRAGIAVRSRVRETLQHHNSNPFRENRAVRPAAPQSRTKRTQRTRS